MHAQNPSTAQPLVIGWVDALPSQALAETRLLNIYLPDEYAQDSTRRFPVIYLLDGSAGEDMLHVFGLVQFLNMVQVLPPTIVVGIANVDRRRDFTFPTRNQKDLQDYPTTGHSATFIQFLATELQPYIARQYRCDGQSTLIGQSLGGLLATEILLKNPALFDRYIIVSPSLWWDDESLLAAAPALLQQQADMRARAFICVGKEGAAMERVAAALADNLKSAHQRHLKVDFEKFPTEDHGTILHRAVYRALEVMADK